jgi:hypothetical protein
LPLWGFSLPALRAASRRQNKPPITCTAGADCDAKWSRAASWIALNPAWKIKTRTDRIIETTGHDSLPAFAVTKVATTPGNYEITFEGVCGWHNHGRDSKVSCSRNKADSLSALRGLIIGISVNRRPIMRSHDDQMVRAQSDAPAATMML